jgi:hypothetical protein
MELTILRGEVIHVKSSHGIDPYFKIPITRSMKVVVEIILPEE